MAATPISGSVPAAATPISGSVPVAAALVPDPGLVADVAGSAGAADAGLPSFPVSGVSLVELAGLLDGVQVADLSFGEVLEVVAGFEQLIRAAQAAQAVAVRELEVRRPVHPSPVPDQLACTLVTTRRSAEMLMVRASLTASFPAVHEAWAAGILDARKVDILLGEVMHADPSGRDAAVAVGLAAAPRMTGPQLARHVRAAVLALDPGAAEKRRVDGPGRIGPSR